MPRANRFTIYDALEKSGLFDSNPANSFARSPTDGSTLFQGPVPYPKMLYHPQGEERVTNPAELINTPMGPRAVGEQREMLHRIVNNAAEEAEAVAEGWHDHPAKGVRARVELVIANSPELSEDEKAKMLKAIPAISSDDRIRLLEAELARLTNDKRAEKVETQPPSKAEAKPAAKPSAAA